MRKRVISVLCSIIFISSLLFVSCGGSGSGDNSFIPFKRPDKSEEESKPEESTVLSEEMSEVAEESSDETEEESRAPFEPGITYEYHGTTIVLPKDFSVEVNDDDIVSVKPAEYPVHTDNIVLTFAKGGKVSQYSEKLYLASIKTASPEMFGNLEKFDEYTATTVDGHKALIIRYSVNYSGINMKFTQCIVEVSSGVTAFTFTTLGYYEDAFEASLESIKVKE